MTNRDAMCVLSSPRTKTAANWLAGVLIGLCMALPIALGQERKAEFRAGAATSNITPWLGVSLNGGMSDRKANHVHDELHAGCLVLDDGKTRIAFAVCDMCMVPREIMDQAKSLVHAETRQPVENILISATHTHEAPTAAGVFQSEPDLNFPPFLARRIADGIRRAINNLEPARIGWGVGNEPTQVFNRRWFMKPSVKLADPFAAGTDKVQMNPPVESENLDRPAGPTDPDVSLVSVQSKNGRPSQSSQTTRCTTWAMPALVLYRPIISRYSLIGSRN